MGDTVIQEGVILFCGLPSLESQATQGSHNSVLGGGGEGLGDGEVLSDTVGLSA